LNFGGFPHQHGGFVPKFGGFPSFMKPQSFVWRISSSAWRINALILLQSQISHCCPKEFPPQSQSNKKNEPPKKLSSL